MVLKPKKKRSVSGLLFIASWIMLISALPMMVWCLDLVNTASVDKDYTYAGVGVFAASILYVFSMVTAIAGLSFHNQGYRLKWCIYMGGFQLGIALGLFFLLWGYTVVTLPPLYFTTSVYILGASLGKRKYEASRFP
ncbi:MAG TPA: hypothetical protein DEA52_05030 [Clostridiaceae bacterium]|nr:hypothetical protein [Clostridiaceae bacterium]